VARLTYVGGQGVTVVAACRQCMLRFLGFKIFGVEKILRFALRV